MSARLKILCILGTRPEGIKLAPVVRQLQARNDRFELKVCSTGQHRAMLRQVLQLFAITPDSDLQVMDPDRGPGAIAGLILQRLDPILADFQPDWVLVQGDTTTVAAASLAAFYRRIKLGHVEAGLRTHDRWQPFPEEMNRRLASLLAERHFAATPQARDNLLCERIPAGQILVTGNTVIDALQWAIHSPPPPLAMQLVPPDGRRLLLVTVHRRENLGRPLTEILSALRTLSAQFAKQIRILFPVHLNPQVRQPVVRALSGLENVTLIEPLDYRSMIYVLEHAELVLTDSGGLQEEAPALGKPVLVLRETTERPEAVRAGTVRLVGTSQENIVTETAKLLQEPETYAAMSRAINPYGDGRAAQRIVASLAGEPVEEFQPASALDITQHSLLPNSSHRPLPDPSSEVMLSRYD